MKLAGHLSGRLSAESPRNSSIKRGNLSSPSLNPIPSRRIVEFKNASQLEKKKVLSETLQWVYFHTAAAGALFAKSWISTIQFASRKKMSSMSFISESNYLCQQIPISFLWNIVSKNSLEAIEAYMQESSKTSSTLSRRIFGAMFKCFLVSSTKSEQTAAGIAKACVLNYLWIGPPRSNYLIPTPPHTGDIPIAWLFPMKQHHN